MSTITLEIEPKLFKQAESVLKDIGLFEEGAESIRAGRCYTLDEVEHAFGLKSERG